MTPVAAATPTGLDVEAVRRDFPALHQQVHGRPLVYLDNAATTQRPRQVIGEIVRFYEQDNANIHRGVHLLSERATKLYEGAREKVRAALNATLAREIIFVRGTTEAINLVAQTFGRANLGPGDEILVSAMEHHSDIVPWQMICQERGAALRVIPVDDRGDLILEELERLLSPRVKLAAVVHVSNALGTVNPIRQITALARAHGVPVLVDGAQAMAHMAVDVRELDVDFYAFSAHKMCGPTGVGVLYGKSHLLETMPPWQGGGDMIRSVTFEKTTYNTLPHRFEAGTPDIAGVIGLGAAIDYLHGIGLSRIAAHEDAVLAHGLAALSEIPGLRLIGTPRRRAGVISFVLDGIHPHDIGTILDREGIAIRTGHHCAQPVMQRFGIPATARASLALYSTREELDALARGLRRVLEVFA
ncbi:MAG: cysteine desulfurase [Candidatus Sumerlaeia bacterium]|nr:cysteine desulfurase [Candidatus Sumerlaeia bacterium]